MIKKRQIDFNIDTVLEGAGMVAAAVGSTLGPWGNNVIFEQEHTYPLITKDGVTVARQITLEDAQHNVGAQIIREVGENVVKEAGDGTTTATILAYEMMKAGIDIIRKEGVNGNTLKKEIDKIVDMLMAYMDEKLITHIAEDDFSTIRQIALISCNGDDKIAQLITDCFKEVGKEGVIDVMRSRTGETYAEKTTGFVFDRGYERAEFCNVENKMQVFYEKALVFIYGSDMKYSSDYEKAVQYSASQRQPLLVLAESFTESIIEQMLTLTRSGTVIVPVKLPGFGDGKKFVTEDISALVGGTKVTHKELSIFNQSPEKFLGTCERFLLEKNTTTIMEYGGDMMVIQERINSIKSQLKENLTDYEKAGLKQRLSSMHGSAATIYVGGKSEIELSEKKDRVEDAVFATRSAMEGGYVAGGGLTTGHLAAVLNRYEQKTPGVKLLITALKRPFEKIHNHAGMEAVQMDERKVSLNGVITDYVAKGILDPAKVVKSTIKNAASVAGTMLTTRTVITLVNKNQYGV